MQINSFNFVSIGDDGGPQPLFWLVYWMSNKKIKLLLFLAESPAVSMCNHASYQADWKVYCFIADFPSEYILEKQYL